MGVLCDWATKIPLSVWGGRNQNYERLTFPLAQKYPINVHEKDLTRFGLAGEVVR